MGILLSDNDDDVDNVDNDNDDGDNDNDDDNADNNDIMTMRKLLTLTWMQNALSIKWGVTKTAITQMMMMIIIIIMIMIDMIMMSLY